MRAKITARNKDSGITFFLVADSNIPNFHSQRQLDNIDEAVSHIDEVIQRISENSEIQNVLSIEITSDPRTVGWAELLKQKTVLPEGFQFEVINLGVDYQEVQDLIDQILEARGEIDEIVSELKPKDFVAKNPNANSPKTSAALRRGIERDTNDGNSPNDQVVTAVPRLEAAERKIEKAYILFKNSLPTVERFLADTNPEYQAATSDRAKIDVLKALGLSENLSVKIVTNRAPRR